MKKLFLLFIFLVSCSSDEENRFEVINKLRAIGANASPSFISQDTAALSNVEIQFHVVMPIGNEISLENYQNPDIKNIVMNLEPDPTSISYVNVGSLRFASFKAKGTIPPEVKAIKFDGFTSFAVSYGVTVKSGAESENIQGSILVYKSDSMPTVNDMKIAIKPDLTFKKSTKSVLSATLTNPIGENYKIGWFVSSGIVENRRSLDTFWTPKESGIATVIVTARGLQTGSFTYDSSAPTVSE